MEDRITVYSIELLEAGQGKSFYEFMHNEIFPGVYKGVTRTGKVTGLVLLAGNIVGRSHEYLWLVYGKSLIHGGAARGQIEKIEAFGAKVSPIQDFTESIRWFAEDEDLEPVKLLLDEEHN